MSVRDDLVAELRKVVGPDRKVHIIPAQDSVDVIDRPTIMFKQQRIAPLEASPRGALRIDYVLTFITPGDDATKAEARLDEWVPDILDDLNHLSWFVWTEARKVLFEPLNMAYDVEAYVITTPANGTRPSSNVRSTRPPSRPAGNTRNDVLTIEGENHG